MVALCWCPAAGPPATEADQQSKDGGGDDQPVRDYDLGRFDDFACNLFGSLEPVLTKTGMNKSSSGSCTDDCSMVGDDDDDGGGDSKEAHASADDDETDCSGNGDDTVYSDNSDDTMVTTHAGKHDTGTTRTRSTVDINSMIHAQEEEAAIEVQLNGIGQKRRKTRPFGINAGLGANPLPFVSIRWQVSCPGDSKHSNQWIQDDDDGDEDEGKEKEQECDEAYCVATAARPASVVVAADTEKSISDDSEDTGSDSEVGMIERTFLDSNTNQSAPRKDTLIASSNVQDDDQGVEDTHTVHTNAEIISNATNCLNTTKHLSRVSSFLDASAGFLNGTFNDMGESIEEFVSSPDAEPSVAPSVVIKEIDGSAACSSVVSSVITSIDYGAGKDRTLQQTTAALLGNIYAKYNFEQSRLESCAAFVLQQYSGREYDVIHILEDRVAAINARERYGEIESGLPLMLSQIAEENSSECNSSESDEDDSSSFLHGTTFVSSTPALQTKYSGMARQPLAVAEAPMDTPRSATTPTGTSNEFNPTNPFNDAFDMPMDISDISSVPNNPARSILEEARALQLLNNDFHRGGVLQPIGEAFCEHHNTLNTTKMFEEDDDNTFSSRITEDRELWTPSKGHERRRWPSHSTSWDSAVPVSDASKEEEPESSISLSNQNSERNYMSSNLTEDDQKPGSHVEEIENMEPYKEDIAAHAPSPSIRLSVLDPQYKYDDKKFCQYVTVEEISAHHRHKDITSIGTKENVTYPRKQSFLRQPRVKELRAQQAERQRKMRVAMLANHCR